MYLLVLSLGVCILVVMANKNLVLVVNTNLVEVKVYSVAHTCGEPGHIRPNCPNPVKRVSSPTLELSMSRKHYFIKGFINDSPCDMFIDRGCEVTCVTKHLIPNISLYWQNYLVKRV